MLIAQQQGLLPVESIKIGISAAGSVLRKFAYIAAFRQLGNNEELARMVRLSNDLDIFSHHEIYFADETAA